MKARHIVLPSFVFMLVMRQSVIIGQLLISLIDLQTKKMQVAKIAIMAVCINLKTPRFH